MRTERLTILITADEKAELNAKAERLGVTASDLVRLAVENFDAEGADAILRMVAEQIEQSIDQMNAALDDAHDHVQNTLKAMRAERAAAREEQVAA